MAGLLGNFFGGGQDRNNMGILAGAQPMDKPSGWDIASLLAATAADSYAGYRGRPGGNVNGALQTMKNTQVQKARGKLIEDLQSPDPQTRQRAYMFAQLQGIDTKPFQQQQANQQLPALLQSMRPSTQSMPGAGATLNDGSQLNTDPISFQNPGLNISEAIQQAPPELQAQYAPKLLDQQIQMAQNAVRPATAEEKRAAGLSEKVPAQIDASGKLSPITDPFQITPFQQANLDRQGMSAAEQARHDRAMEAHAAAGVGKQNIPAGYRPTADGRGLEYIPGGPADPTKGAGKKAPTEDQAKNTQLYQRASQQLPIALKHFDALSSPSNQIGASLPFIGGAATTSGDYQSGNNAVMDIAASYLYSVSGATANPGEVKNLAQTIVPKFGDKPAVVEEKKQRLAQMVESIKARAQPSAPPASPAGLPRLNAPKIIRYDAQGNRIP